MKNDERPAEELRSVGWTGFICRSLKIDPRDDRQQCRWRRGPLQAFSVAESVWTWLGDPVAILGCRGKSNPCEDDEAYPGDDGRRCSLTARAKQLGRRL